MISPNSSPTTNESAWQGRYTGGPGTTSATRPPAFPPPRADIFDSTETAVMPFPKTAALLEVEVEGHKLTMPLLVSVAYNDGFYEIEHQDFGIFGRGTTCEEAVADLLEYLIADYRAYGEESDDKLDKYAQELARRYRRLFGRR